MLFILLGDGSRNTAYTQFHIETNYLGNNSVEAYIKTNKMFDYDDLSRITKIVAIQKTFVVLGATREWYLMILAHDSGEVQRQSNSLPIFLIYIFSTVNLVLALCSLHIKLIDINDNPPGKTKSNCNKRRKKNLNYVFSIFKF